MRSFSFLAALAAANADFLWPKPKSVTFGSGCVGLSASSTTFTATGATSDILTQAIARYEALIFSKVPPVQSSPCRNTAAGAVSVDINVTSGNAALNLATVEAYSLVVSGASSIVVTAETVYGALRGLETLSQLVDYLPASGIWAVPASTIQDAPLFAHRGALLDTARHFLKIDAIKAFIDAMAYNKMNVLHWHLVDDQSFPFVSASYPSLSALGAYGAPNPATVAAHTYSPADVQAVIQYAQYRGIRVIAEFDTPGHSQSWGAGAPAGLLTQCYNTTTGQPIPGSFGPIDPTHEPNYAFLQGLLKEATSVFPGEYDTSAKLAVGLCAHLVASIAQ